MLDRKSRALKLIILNCIVQFVFSPSMFDIIYEEEHSYYLVGVLFLSVLVIFIPGVCFFCLENHQTSAFNAVVIIAHLRVIPIMQSFPLMAINKEFFNNMVFLSMIQSFETQFEVYICYQSNYVKILSTIANGLTVGAMVSIKPSEENLHSVFEICQQVVTQPNFYKYVSVYFLSTWIFKLHSDTNTRQILQIAHHMNKNQIMYNTITDNLDEIIVVRNGVQGLHYFNQKGLNCLNEAADLTQHQSACKSGLLSLNEQIMQFEEIKLTPDQQEFQSEIFQAKVFRSWT